MAVDRTLIIKGPAKITFDSASIFSLDDIRVRWITNEFEVRTTAFGRTARRVRDRRIEVDVTPAMWSDLTKLLPYATKQIGDTIFGATDKSLVITPRNGAPLTLANAAVTQLPNLTFSVDKPLLRPMRFTALCANNSNAATAANWFAFGSPASDVALTGFDGSKIYNDLYSVARNTVTYRSEAGFNVDFTLGLVPDQVDGDAVVNYRITELEAVLKFVPSAITEAAYATLLGWDTKGIGAEPAGHNAVISGTASGSPTFTIVNTLPAQGSAAYGGANRTGEIELVSTRTISTNALTALWTIGTVA